MVFSKHCMSFLFKETPQVTVGCTAWGLPVFPEVSDTCMGSNIIL
jgi:hypothetical protein